MTQEILERAKALDEQGLLVGEVLRQLSTRHRLMWEEKEEKEREKAVDRLLRKRRPEIYPGFGFDGRELDVVEHCTCCPNTSHKRLIEHCRTRPHISRLAEERPNDFRIITGHRPGIYSPLMESLVMFELDELGLLLE
jgi:hypothetical protein